MGAGHNCVFMYLVLCYHNSQNDYELQGPHFATAKPRLGGPELTLGFVQLANATAIFHTPSEEKLIFRYGKTVPPQQVPMVMMNSPVPRQLAYAPTPHSYMPSSALHATISLDEVRIASLLIRICGATLLTSKRK